ncbi:HDOD domain-containing protein [Sphingomonas sp. NCPPB 2930]
MPDTAPSAPAAPAPHADAALEFLLRRMRHRSDFPALSESVVRILKTADSDRESLADLTQEILKDVALTQKLLRLVNSVQFARSGQGTIGTISRAVSLVGFNTVRNLALSLVLLDQMQDKTHAQQMKEEFVRALVAGAVAGELSPDPRESEAAFLCAVFQRLGRMLVCFYFQEEADEIRRLLSIPDAPTGEEAEQAVSAQVLGLGYEDLAVGVARAWALPDTLQRGMRRPTGQMPARALEDPAERLRWVAALAGDVAAVAVAADPATLPDRLREVARRHAGLAKGGAEALARAAAEARRRTSQLTQAMELRLEAGSATAIWLQPEPTPAEAPAPAEPLTVEQLRGSYAQARAERAAGTAPAAAPAVAAPPPVRSSAEMLSAGVQEIVDAMAGSGMRLDDIVRMVMATMLRGLGFRCVVFCLRDNQANVLQGRFGLGEGQAAAVRALRVPLGTQGDLFSAVCLRGGDLLVADTTSPRELERLPAWYRQHFDAGAFVLLPLMRHDKPFALLYADHAQPGGIVLDERGFALLRTLRNQAVMAFRQAG